MNAKSVVKKLDQLPAVVGDFEQHANEGFESADIDSYAIPFLTVLQSGSPQAKRSEGAYIPGAAEGMLLDTVENTLYDPSQEPVLVVPVYFRRAYVEWKTREKGGGYVQEHPVTTMLAQQTQRDDKNRDILPNGNQLVDTRYHYVLMLDPEGFPRPYVITMSSTQIKRSKRWMSVMQGIKLPSKSGGFFTPPSYSHIYELRTVPESNDQGSWFSWQINIAKNPDGSNRMIEDPALVTAAKAFLEAVKGGKIKEATPTDVHGSEEGQGEF